jgi:hypothetical protein
VNLTDQFREPSPPELLRAAMHFLTTTRSEEHYNAIERKMSSCRCPHNSASRFLHDGHATDFTDDEFFFWGFTAVCSMLTRTLVTFKRGHFPKSPNPRKRTWPADMDDLLQGASNCQLVVDNMLKWTDNSLHRHSHVFKVFGALVRFSRHFVVEQMKSHIWLERVFSLLQLILDTFNSLPRTDTARWRNYVREPLENATYWLENISLFVQEGYMHPIFMERDAMVRFHKLACLVLEMVKSEKFGHLDESGRDIGSSVYAPTWTHFQSIMIKCDGLGFRGYRSESPSPPMNSQSTPDSEHSTCDINMTFSLLVQTRTRDQCMNPWCTFQSSEMTDRRTKICEGCLTIRFCSSKVCFPKSECPS